MKKILVVMAVFIFSLCNLANASTVGLWTFDEEVGNIAYDSSGHGNNGTIYGGAARINDTPFSYSGNRAMSFDGINDYINCGSSSVLNLTTFTLEAWVKPETVGYRYIAIKGNKYAIELSDGTANPKGWFTTGADDIYHILVSPIAIPMDTWTHFATTKDDNALKLYVNGELKNTLILPDSGSYSPGIEHNDDFIIGDVNAFNYFTHYYFDGLIDDVRVSDTALTPEELGYYKSFGAPVPEPATMLLLPLGLAGFRFFKRRSKMSDKNAYCRKKSIVL